jgi:septum site-determining protein MinC
MQPSTPTTNTSASEATTLSAALPKVFSNKATPAFELKGSLFTLAVLHLLSPDLNAFVAELRRHAQKTPNLFKSMPVVIDLQRISRDEREIDFTSFQHLLKQHGLIPVGIRHGNEKQNLAAQAAGLPLLSSQSSQVSAKTKAKVAEKKLSEIPTGHTMVVTSPVRSGQQIYAKDANLIVLAQVSHGAEILADGHIHVYGTLRGRALAGIKGDKTARIFCQYLDAELVSIAGVYKLHDSLPTSIVAPIIQIYLESDKIQVEGISGK